MNASYYLKQSFSYITGGTFPLNAGAIKRLRFCTRVIAYKKGNLLHDYFLDP